MKQYLHDLFAKSLNDFNAAVLKLLGGVGVAALSPEEWAAVATCAYFFVQTAYLIWKWRNESNDRKNKKK